MRVLEFGQPNADVILLLHEGGLSWWNYRDSAELLHQAIPDSSLEILNRPVPWRFEYQSSAKL